MPHLVLLVDEPLSSPANCSSHLQGRVGGRLHLFLLNSRIEEDAHMDAFNRTMKSLRIEASFSCLRAACRQLPPHSIDTGPGSSWG